MVSGKGIGIGLYLLRRAAELLNIKVRVESEIGSGTVFFVDISSKN